MTFNLKQTKQTLRLVTRKSALALWQANYVKHYLELLHAGIVVDVIGVSTAGDENLETSLSKIGGKALFVKELEAYLLDNKADIAVHSMKDVPAGIPEGLCIEVILERADPRDVVVMSLNNVAKGITTLAQLPSGVLVGTSSLRRQSQLYAIRSDVQVKTLRGNVDSRVKKLDKGEFDAIILAAAGLERLGLNHRMSEILEPARMLPAVGQGALGIECRLADAWIRALIRPLDHPPTGCCVKAERRMNARLGGSCQLPVAGFACIQEEGHLTLKGLVGTVDGRVLIHMEATGPTSGSETVGDQVAIGLLAQGAQDIIDGCVS